MMRFYLYILALQFLAGSTLMLPYPPVPLSSFTLHTSNFNNSPSLILHRSSFISPPSADSITLVPDVDTVDFNVAVAGLYRDTTIILQKATTAPAPIVIDPIAGPDSVQFQALSGLANDSVTSYAVVIRFAPQDTGAFTATYHIAGGNINRTVELRGRGLPGAKLGTRDTMDFGDVNIQASDSCRRIIDTVHNRSHIQLRLSGTIQGDNQRFTLENAINETVVDTLPGRLPYAVRFCTADTGTFGGTLVLASNAGTRTIVLRGRGMASGSQGGQADSVHASTDSVDFGDVLVDSCLQRTIIIRNTSLENITIMHALRYITGAGTFSIVPAGSDTTTIPAGDSAQVKVSFCPNSMGISDAYDSVHDASRQLSIPIRLRGRGVQGILLMQDTVVFVADPPGCVTLAILRGNIGNVPISVARPALGAGPFSFNPLPASPVTLNPGDIDTIYIQYCPVDTNTARDLAPMGYLIGVAGNPLRTDSILLIGIPRTGGRALLPLIFSSDSLDFGGVVIGGCKTDSLKIINPNDSAIAIDSTFFVTAGGPRPPGFTIVLPTSFPRVIPANDSISVLVRFCPDTAHSNAAFWLVVSEGVPRPVFFYGSPASDSGSAGRHIWLDSNLKATVGVPFRLGLWIASDISGIARLDSVKISFDKKSLFPVATIARVGFGERAAFHYVNDHTIMAAIVSDSALPVAGKLFDLELVGLTTGVPENIVHIDSAYFTGNVPDGVRHGLVLLNGCDLGRDPGISRKAVIRSISSGSGSSLLTVMYRAPEGASPRLSVIDLSGRVIRAATLPAATGSDENAQVELNDISPGVYLVELSIGTDRSTTQIMITK